MSDVGVPLIASARSIVEDVLSRRLAEAKVLDEEGYEDLVVFLTRLRVQSSMWALSSVVQIEEIWDLVRGVTPVFNTVMSITGELRLRLVTGWSESPGRHGDWEKLCRSLAHAYGEWGTKRPKSLVDSCMDEDTLDRLPSYSFMVQALDENPWLVTLMLIETLPYQS